MAQIAHLDKKRIDPDSAIGTWISDAQDSKMEIYKYGSPYRGKLLAGWGNELLEKDGRILKKIPKTKISVYETEHF